MAGLKLACVLLVCMVVAAPMANAAITCGQVNSNIAPCITYLRGTGGPPPPACCSGVRRLAGLASTTPDRQQACRCLQDAARRAPVNPNLAAGLPSQCGVNIPYKFSTSINCNNIK